MTKLDDLEKAVTALVARADAAMRTDKRADGASKSGSVTLYSSEELNLGRQGSGEVEFFVTAAYKLDFEFKSIKNVYGGWRDGDDKPTKDVPRAAIEAALRKIIDRNPRRFVDALIEKL